jgi:hypothetical protein
MNPGQSVVNDETKPRIPDRGKDRVVWRDGAPHYRGAVVVNPVQERLKEEDQQTNAEREEMLHVALTQPHRKGFANASAEASKAGSSFSRLSEPLGRLCATPQPSTGRPLGDHCWQAGQRYAEIVKEFKTAWGFDVEGWAPGSNGMEPFTPEQIEARKQLAISRKKEADEVLTRIIPRLPRAMERLCYDQLEPSIYDASAIVNGLVKLAKIWGFGQKRFGEN